MLSLASPELDKSLEAALESYTANSSALEVFALRLKTGVFGRNAPKRQMTVRRNIGGDEDLGLETVPIGEWPVVVRNTGINADDVNESVFNYTESSNTIFLDNSYEGILPGSWVVVDAGGVPVFNSKIVQVEPTVFPGEHEADKRVAQAKAEERRALAVATEQENRAKVEEMRAKVVEAESEVPLAIAQAFRDGNLGIMDYFQLENIQSDTGMRGSIGRAADESSE